jgi:predicted transcriptional regulator
VAGKKPSVISGREFAILKLLWEHGALTVREIRSHLADEEAIPYTTVLSLVQLMERKGYLRHEAQGKTYRYLPRVKREKMTRQLLRDFIGRFFDGSPEALVMGLAETEVIDADTFEQLQGEIRDSEESSDE